MNRPNQRSSSGRIGLGAFTGAGIGTAAIAVAAFVSLRGGFFTRGAKAEFTRPEVAFDCLEDGVIEVPEEARSLQAAVDFAPDGAVIRVSQGTFVGPVACDGKSIVIEGQGPDATVLRGFGVRPVLSFRGSGESTVVVRGMSVVGGRGAEGAGLVLEGVRFDARDLRIAGNQGCGALVRGGSGEFDACTFEGNRSPGSGGGFRNEGGRVQFVGCTFRHNVSTAFGGAVASKGGRVELLACTLEDNSTHSGAWGGAVFGSDAVVELHGSEFARNRAINAGGAVYLAGGVADISKCSFTGNLSDEARSLYSRGAGVRIASSHLCGIEAVALGGDFAFGDGNVFDASCFGDCNQNGVSDTEELELGWVADRDGNGVPDACDPDCNSNGLPDGYEIAGGFAQDMNANGLIDICEIRSGLALDVDNDWIPDDAQVPAMDALAPPPQPSVQRPSMPTAPPDFDPWVNGSPMSMERTGAGYGPGAQP